MTDQKCKLCNGTEFTAGGQMHADCLPLQADLA